MNLEDLKNCGETEWHQVMLHWQFMEQKSWEREMDGLLLLEHLGSMPLPLPSQQPLNQPQWWGKEAVLSASPPLPLPLHSDA